MARQVIAEVTGPGGPLAPSIDFLEIELTQTLFGHQAVTLVLPFDVIEGADAPFFSRAPQRLLGQPVAVVVRPESVFASAGPGSASELRFKGVITDLSTAKDSDYMGHVTVRAFSPCYLLSDGRQKRTFVNQTLTAIFQQVLAPYPANLLPHRLQPVHQAPLPYAAQYDETNYAFLSRLASEYAEWFFYDGHTLQLGPPPGGPAVEFVADGVHNRFDFGLSLRPTRATLYDYNYLRHEHLTADTAGQPVAGLHQHPYGRLVLAESEKLFAQPARLNAETFLGGSGQLHEEAQARHAHSAAQLVTLRGESDHLGLQLGGLVAVSGEGLGSRHFTPESFGTYRLVELTHRVDARGNYRNSFTAIPHLLGGPPPNPHHAPPVGTPELAEVIDVRDPQMLGRVRVRYYWCVQHRTDAETGWLRVLTPYSGDGKGQLFTPEVGSQVLVGYECNLAEQPVVLGNLFHAHNKQGAKYSPANNGMKGLQTSGGNKVVMMDRPGEQKIMISNSNNKSTAITVDFQGDGSVNINSCGPVTIHGSSILLDAHGDICLQGQNISLAAKENINLHGQNIRIEADQSLALMGHQVASLKSDVDVLLNAEKISAAGLNIEAVADAELTLEGLTTNVKGVTMTVEGTATADVKGPIVNIN